jgi:hypothetical protein
MNHPKRKEVVPVESEQYGDEAPCVIVDENNVLVLEDVYNGFDDYVEFVEED